MFHLMAGNKPESPGLESGIKEADNSSSRLAVLLSLSLAVSLFLYNFGYQSLNPTNIGFIFRMGGDLATSYFGWAFFRESPWSFPIGKLVGYFYPIGSYSTIVGGNPILTIPLKLISPWLPVDFQYFGWWLLICYCLQAYFGYRLMRLITPNILQQVLGVGFFLLSPSLLYRITQGHDGPSAQWIILAAFTLYFENYSSIKNKNVILYWALLIVVAFPIFTYFSAMTMALATAFSIGHLFFSPAYRLQLIGGMVLYPLLVFATFASLGFFNAEISYQWDLLSYTTYSLNLNAFINPLQWSSILPSLSYRLGQTEGYNYLGLGIIILAGYSIIYLIWQRPKFNHLKYLLPFGIVLLLFFIYAISNRVTWGNILLFKYPLPEPLLRMVNILRCSGRFGIPLFYAILYGSLFCVVALRRKTLSIALMAACLAIQAVDIHKLLFNKDFHQAGPVASPLKAPVWQSLGGKFDKILIYPPFISAISYEDDYKYFLLYAYKNHLAINTGFPGRLPLKRMQLHKEELQESFRRGHLDPKAIYIFADPVEAETLKLFNQWEQCALVDGYMVYTTDGRFLDGANSIKLEPLTFLDFLKKYEGDTILIAAREYVARVLLPDGVKQYLQQKGSRLEELGFKGSYVGVFRRGEKAVEKLSEQGAVKLDLPRPAAPSGREAAADRDIELYSAGVPFGNRASIKIAGVEYSRGRGGLNLVAIDRHGQVLASTFFGVNNPDSTTVCYLNKSKDLKKTERLTPGKSP
jgi:hypothetical protein